MSPLLAFAAASANQSEFLGMLLKASAVAAVIFVLAAGALILFWKSLSADPGAAADKGSEGARVNRSFFIRLAVLIGVLLLMSVVIFLAAVR